MSLTHWASSGAERGEGLGKERGGPITEGDSGGGGGGQLSGLPLERILFVANSALCFSH
jgi:hypothetical protein